MVPCLTIRVVTRYQNNGIIPNTRAKQAEYFREMTRSRNDVIFAIVDDKSGRHIGSAGLHTIDWIIVSRTGHSHRREKILGKRHRQDLVEAPYPVRIRKVEPA
jgi:RimJ/RimL family protein N-acetyltransferase